ncbi:DNA topoisomerase (ATP-hydrolyzing) subunit B [endosymbiont of Pachyrhynchus infernalis]|uniref:DNA topoisomerase (ATP-hydrolyzing) subunit B n=1 Tax=endosymbiont of Pachyrhynchus infernalis TaxID=1971488 RepID=UPI000DC7185B|nr:DNA topoisomerase (ATP-hydrolyzing) subunit B [endosymbiont of Pachyrhynchus infernalis]BBA84753.1 DNA gyrase subunit B [endosymbiont of Pachyrhynchus infernalis]
MSKYDSSSIKVLKGLDAVKKRPGMYIGNTDDGTGFHHMLFEVIDNSIDEYLAGYCNKISVCIYKDNSISVEDNGRGIPIDIHKEENISAAELIMTTLHAGGKFDNLSYEISGGLHGVGISVVNALSEKLQLIIYRNGYIYEQIYSYGLPKDKIKIIGKSNNNGTFIRFWPDLNIFTNNTNFQFNLILSRLKEISYLNSNISIQLEDLRKDNSKKIIENNDGIKSFIKDLIKDKDVIHNNIFYMNSNKNNINVEIALQWINSFQDIVYCFTNNIKQKDGGTHLSGFRSSITKTINNYIEKEEIYKRSKLNIIGEDTREGLVSVISIKYSSPKFSSQTKDKLISPEIKNVVESLLSDYLMDFLLENQNDSKLIINKIIQSSKSREAAKKAKETIRKKNNDIFNLLGKLSDCQENNPDLSELYLVEGDSAGGSAKQGRNRKNQAILPLKGKIINVEKSKIDKILSSQEIVSLITALGCGIENHNFNIDKIRYKKIIIMTDADIDGSHIRTLLLTFFYRYIPEIINNGYLFIAQPPLYKIKFNKNEIFIKTHNELIDFKIKLFTKNITLFYDNKSISSIELEEILRLYIDVNNLIIKLKNIYPYILLNEILNSEYTINKNDLYNFNKINKWSEDICLNINKQFKFEKCTFNIFNNNNIFEPIFIINDYLCNEYKIDNCFLESNEYKKILNFIKIKNKIIFDNKSYIKYNNLVKEVNSFKDFINYIINDSRINIDIQRYKGLGEMNPDQLWYSTMDPNNRTLLKVLVENNNKSDNLFSILMGDNVESRKKFIEENSLNVNNLDI